MAILEYTDDCAEDWDRFVEASVNGNFLQSRRFLSYHPEGRFEDASLIYQDQKGNMRAVIPAICKIDANGKKLFISHGGSTYGGLVVGTKMCAAKHIQALLDELLSYLEHQGYSYVDLRFPPDFMWKRPEAGLFEYMMRLNGFEERIELTTYIDFDCYKESILSNFAQGKRTNVNNGKKKGLAFRILTSYGDAEKLHALLTENLKKFDAKPVHTVDELWDLYKNRLPGETEIVGVFDGDDLLAAGWVFLFSNMNAMHTQYLCADSAYSKLSPMTFLYYSVIDYCKSEGYRYLSWGISTEDSGRVINWGLTESKEHFGSVHGVHRSYGKWIA